MHRQQRREPASIGESGHPCILDAQRREDLTQPINVARSTCDGRRDEWAPHGRGSAGPTEQDEGRRGGGSTDDDVRRTESSRDIPLLAWNWPAANDRVVLAD